MHCLLLFVCLLPKNLVHCSSLVYLFVTRESRALYLLLFICLSCTNLTPCFVFGLLVIRKNLTQCFFSCWFVCYTRISRTVSSLVCLFVTQGSRALFHLLFFLLRKNLVHCFFSRLFVYYARISRTVSSLFCLFVTRGSPALFHLPFVFLLQESRALFLLSFVCLL